jgi:hypothetical protein
MASTNFSWSSQYGWVLTNKPSHLGALSSKSNKLQSPAWQGLVLKGFEWQLTKHKSLLLQHFHLNPQWKSLKDGRRGVRWLFQVFQTVQHENGQEPDHCWGYGGIYTPLQKLAVEARGARKLQANVWRLWILGSGHSRLREIYWRGTYTQRLRVYIEILRTLCPDIPDLESPDSPGTLSKFMV